MTVPALPSRWATRHVQRSIAKRVWAALDDLGWFETEPGFAEHPITWDADHDTESAVAGEEAPPPNLVGLSMMDVPDSQVEECGAGLYSIDYPVTFDIYGENRSVASNISDDIQGILQGVLAPSRYIPLYDFSTVEDGVLVTEETCEARFIEARWVGGSGTEWRRRWRVVQFTATRFFTGPGE
jgi:hypothetical protein